MEKTRIYAITAQQLEGFESVNGNLIVPDNFEVYVVPSAEDDVFPDLEDGTYSVSVKDANNLTDTVAGIALKKSVSIVPRLSVLNITHPSAENDNGVIGLTASSGVSPYQYSLNGGDFQASNLFSNLPEGEYSALVKDSLGVVGGLSGIKLKASVYVDRRIRLNDFRKKVTDMTLRKSIKTIKLKKYKP